MSHLTYEIITHPQKVCRLYKRALREMENYCVKRTDIRYHACVIRERFEKHKHEKDLTKVKKLVEEGEREVFEMMHYQPKQFHDSPGGIAYKRYPHIPDWVLDYWHPLEKAQYPDFFAKREQRKQEYIKFYEKMYGKYDEKAGSAH